MTPCSSLLMAQSPRARLDESISIRVSEGTWLGFDLSSDGRIVFDLLGQLWLVPARGGKARPITNAVRDTAEDLDPSFSPDGRRVVFRAERNGLRGLWLLDIGGDSPAPRQLTQLPNQFAYEGGAAWSPDGKTIAFARVFRPDSAGASLRSIIVLLDASTRAMRELRIDGLPNPDVRDPAWTPDGRRIAFVARSARSGRGGRIWIVDAGGGKATPISAEAVQALAPAFARDGRRLAYFAPDSARRAQVWSHEVFTVADRVARPVRLTNHTDVASTRVRWAEDGKSVVYSADGRLWKVPPIGGRASEIPFTVNLAFTRARRALPAARIALPGEKQSARAFMGLALSPDASRIGAIALGKLWVIPVGGTARAVTDVPVSARYLAWSADGTEVTWSAGDWNKENLFTTNLASGKTRQITALPGRELFPAYSPDGKHVAFAHVRSSEESRLRVFETHESIIRDTMRTRNLGAIGVSWTGSGASPPIWSPNSDGLLIDGGWDANAATRGIFLNLSGARDTLARFPDAPTFLHWTGKNSVVFTRHDRLWRAPFDRTGMLAPPESLGDAPAMYASTSSDGTVLFISEGGLRLRSPDGSERRLGWPISYILPVAAPLLLRNIRIIDGTGAQATSPKDILVQQGRIGRIAEPGGIPATGARVVDAGGRFAVPGLMDLHAHNYRPDLLPGFAYFGVTTLRDQGASMAPLVAYADAIAAGVTPGARVTYGGFQYYSDWLFDEEQGRGVEPEADPDHVKRAVALADVFGSQHIKTRTFRRWDINAAMIAEAHRRGMRVTGHCVHPLPLVAAGINTKEHIGFCGSRGGSFWSDMYIYDDMIQLLRAAKISVVPTISYTAFAAKLNAEPKLLDNDAELAAFLPPRGNFNWMLNLSPEDRDQNTRAAQASRETTAKLARAGITIGTGTDIWQVPTAVHMEMEELVAAGLSPAAAIRAATGDAARIIGAERDLGTIQSGKLADLIILDANPLTDIRNTRRIWAVVQAGRMVDRAAIKEMFRLRSSN